MVIMEFVEGGEDIAKIIAGMVAGAIGGEEGFDP